jgi:hypothetical protein
VEGFEFAPLGCFERKPLTLVPLAAVSRRTLLGPGRCGADGLTGQNRQDQGKDSG